jgi:hypothetical protein
MSKKNKIIIAILIVILVYTVSYIAGRRDQRPVLEEPGFNVTEESRFDPSTVPEPPAEDRFPTESVTLVSTPNYAIVENRNTGLYQVNVLGSPFERARLDAEQAFLFELGITEERACVLNVVVTTPAYANPNDAGINYSLSFCE